MARIAYEKKNFAPKTERVIVQAAQICAEYQRQGFDLTLRQLYYQFVSRDLIPNRQSEYKRLGSIVNDARMAGLLDWSYIVDRTRGIEKRAHFDSPGDVILAAARSYGRDLWAEQGVRVEVWIEKDALTGVIEPTCRRNDITYFSCRGYTSQSEMWEAGQRIGRFIDAGQRVVILHLGDHDPSGLDMTRDITERIDTFVTQDYLNARSGGSTLTSEIRRDMAEHCGCDSGYGGKKYTDGTLEPGGAFEVQRIALTMEQVDEYQPPPNPAKTTDARFEKYAAQYGDESWELDALDPSVLAGLIEGAVDELRDPDVWTGALEQEQTERGAVEEASDRWSEVVDFLAGEENR